MTSLGTVASTIESRQELVETKFFYAGGSCRLMFGYETGAAQDHIRVAVKAVVDISTILTIGDCSPSTINRLFGMFPVPHSNDTTCPLISKFAAREIATVGGEDTIKKFMSTIKSSSNPALNGWMFEILFFAKLRYKGIQLRNESAEDEYWPPCDYLHRDAIRDTIPDSEEWIKPKRWNQGGYDAVMVCKSKNLVRFVQVTSAKKHAFKIKYFSDWLVEFLKTHQEFKLGTLEIVYVVDDEKLHDFSISPITGRGLLQRYGWQSGNEQNQVKILGMEGLYRSYERPTTRNTNRSYTISLHVVLKDRIYEE